MNCPNCGNLLRQVWDNVGFTPPEGPDKWEVIDEVCDQCGYSDERDSEFLPIYNNSNINYNK